MKKIIAITMIAVLTTCLLMGCKNSSNANTQAFTTAYKEHEIELPFDQNIEKGLAFLQLPNQQMILYSRENKTGIYNTYELQKDNIWEKNVSVQLNDFLKDIESFPIIITSGMDGNIYMIYFDNDYIFHVLRQEDTKVEEVIIPQIQEFALSGSRSDPDGIQVMEDGEMVISYSNNKAVLYNKQGNPIREFRQLMGRTNVRFNIGSCPGIFLTKNTDNSDFILYDIKTGDIKNEIKTDMPYTVVTQGKGQDFFLINEKGIHHLTVDGSIIETLIEGDDMPSILAKKSPLSIAARDDNNFYVLYQSSDEKLNLQYYSYDRETSVQEQSSLKIIGLRKSNTLQMVADEFQKKYPNMLIEFETFEEASEKAIPSDILKVISTEILAGEKGPDLIILDGLPVDSYIEKGALADISDVISGLQGADTLLENIDTSSNSKNSIFSLPSRFGIPLIFGAKDALNQFVSLEGLSLYTTTKGAEAILNDTDFQTLSQNLLNMYYGSLASSSFDTKALKLFLDTAAQFGTVIGSKQLDIKEPLPKFGMGYPSDTGKNRAALKEIKSLQDLSLPFTYQLKYNTDTRSIDSMYIPYDTIGINAMSAHLKEAKEFLQMVFSNKMQKIDIGEGFPVNKQIFDDLNLPDTDVDAVISGDNDDLITLIQPNEEQLKEFKKMVINLTKPLTIDSSIQTLILDSVKRVYAGNLTSDKAALELQQKIQLYLSE